MHTVRFATEDSSSFRPSLYKLFLRFRRIKSIFRDVTLPSGAVTRREFLHDGAPAIMVDDHVASLRSQMLRYLKSLLARDDAFNVIQRLVEDPPQRRVKSRVARVCTMMQYFALYHPLAITQPLYFATL